MTRKKQTKKNNIKTNPGQNAAPDKQQPLAEDKEQQLKNDLPETEGSASHAAPEETKQQPAQSAQTEPNAKSGNSDPALQEDTSLDENHTQDLANPKNPVTEDFGQPEAGENSESSEDSEYKEDPAHSNEDDLQADPVGSGSSKPVTQTVPSPTTAQAEGISEPSDQHTAPDQSTGLNQSAESTQSSELTQSTGSSQNLQSDQAVPAGQAGSPEHKEAQPDQAASALSEQELPSVSEAALKEGLANDKKRMIRMGLIGVIIVGMVIGLLVWMVQPKKTGPEPVEVNSDYLVLSTTEIVDQPNSSKSSGKLQPGQSIFIYETLEDEDDGEIWGKISESQWVRLSDDKYDYLKDMTQIDYEAQPENKNYKVKKDTYVYTIPGGTSEPTSSVKSGETVFVQEIAVLDDDTTWGRIGKNQWALIAKGDTPVLEIIEETEEEEEPDEDKDQEDKDDQDKEDKDDQDDKTDQNDESTDHEDTSNPGTSNDHQEVINYTALGGSQIGDLKIGDYFVHYRSEVRRTPTYNGSIIRALDKDILVHIAWLYKGETYNSIWGELDYKGSGYWILIQDDDYKYLTPYDPNTDDVNGEEPPKTDDNSSSDNSQNQSTPVNPDQDVTTNPDSSDPNKPDNNQGSSDQKPDQGSQSADGKDSSSSRESEKNV